MHAGSGGFAGMQAAEALCHVDPAHVAGQLTLLMWCGKRSPAQSRPVPDIAARRAQ